MYLVRFSKQAEKDMIFLKESGLESKAKELLNIIRDNPFHYPPKYEILSRDLRGCI